MSEELVRNELISEGKTKRIFACKDLVSRVIVENKDDITKNDDPTQTRILPGKGKWATETTCNVFRLLKESGIQVSWHERLSDTEFLSDTCRMLPLEVIIRRYAVGSYLNRFPNLKREEKIPHRFHRLMFELFLKTTNGMAINVDGEPVRAIAEKEPLVTSFEVASRSKSFHIQIAEMEKDVEDPLIFNPYKDIWKLFHPKKPSWEKESHLGSVRWNDFLNTSISISQIEAIARKTFLVLESAWSQLEMRLIDFKIELGISSGGHLVVADVIDNDSWRLRTGDWQELSKQLFRDNREMDEVAERYAMVAELTQKFRTPRQALVIWRGSEKDLLIFPKKIPGVDIVDVVHSGHKSPAVCLHKLERILAEYPDGGVIIAAVGKSNGLGPMLAARTSWPVISVPMTAKERPHDVWSSLEMPGQVPLITIQNTDNAILAALNILAQKNPAAYVDRQYAIEELDT
jgi:phosphoribosylaminoimidazole carboxylase / phosphoribosylaminoimidazole-succinocarboxamide synthase